MLVREAGREDLAPLLELYSHLHDTGIPERSSGVKRLWDEIISDRNQYVLFGIIDGRPVSSCVLIVIPNLTNNARPYALLENVVTHREYRRRGCATSVLNRAKEIARKKGCYKIMLLTGSKKEETLNFYEKAGYNRRDKTGFVQWP